jgi:hypothetical protein
MDGARKGVRRWRGVSDLEALAALILARATSQARLNPGLALVDEVEQIVDGHEALVVHVQLEGEGAMPEDESKVAGEFFGPLVVQLDDLARGFFF